MPSLTRPPNLPRELEDIPVEDLVRAVEDPTRLPEPARTMLRTASPEVRAALLELRHLRREPTL